MRRRDLLRLGATLPAALANRHARAQSNTMTRAAVVIGVDRPRDLSPLHAAVSGANKVGDWLEAEGINVKRFLDDTRPVKADDIFDAIDGYVSLGTLQQLIVYFAGHGSFVGTGEYWLLSQALHNSNQAVSVNQCLQSARQCGIPNVVLISDACRSTSASLGIQALTGYNIFPVVNNRRVFTFLDAFFAVRVGAPAYEVRDAAGKYDGIYTTCFLEAYVNPDDNMTEVVDGIKVVPNKKLETYLLSEVPRRAQISDVLQYPDSSVTSSKYLARAEINHIWTPNNLPTPSRCACGGCRGCGASPRPGPKIRSVPATVNNLAEFQLSQAGIQISRDAQPKTFSPDALQKIDKEVGFSANRDLILNARGPIAFRYGTGINVFGTRLRGAFGAAMETQMLGEGNGSNEPASIQIDPKGEHQDSVALEFADGSGTVIAGLRGFVATVVVDQGRVASVSYEQAQYGGAPTFQPDDGIKQLHAMVATAAKFGVFRIDGPPEVRERNAAQLGNTLRMGKLFDPTLGIYAAYAYAEAALLAQIRSVRDIMKSELEIELFDVSLLADVLSGNQRIEAQAPFCPMLNQGWQFLPVRNVTLPAPLVEAQSHILPALWTTFDPAGMSIIKSALQPRPPR
jgi:Caspase domain